MNHDLKPLDYDTRWEAARLPVQHWGRTLKDFPAYDESSHMAVCKAADFVEDWKHRIRPGTPGRRDELGRGLLILGPFGTGKTRLACAILTEIHLTYGRDIYFVPVANYISALSQIPRLNREADQGYEEAGQRLYNIEKRKLLVRTWPLICLDDWGKEHHTASDFAKDTLDELVRDRHRDGLPMLLTSNVKPKDWAGIYGPSMRSFIDEAFDLIDLTGADQRRRH